MVNVVNPLEKVVLADITKYLKLVDIGTVVRHSTGTFNVGSRFINTGIKGTSDLSVELHGNTQTLWIEVKRIGGKVSAEQLVFLDRQRSRGNIAFIAHSVDEVRCQLEAYGLVEKEGKK